MAKVCFLEEVIFEWSSEGYIESNQVGKGAAGEKGRKGKDFRQPTWNLEEEESTGTAGMDRKPVYLQQRWDSSQKVSFKNSRTLWFTGTSVFFSVSRNAVSPRDLMPECVRQHSQSHTAALAVYIPLTGVEEHQLLRKHDTCGAEPPATVTWPIRIRHINSRVTCPCQT